MIDWWAFLELKLHLLWWGKVRTSQFYHRNFIIAILSSQFYHRNFIITVISSRWHSGCFYAAARGHVKNIWHFSCLKKKHILRHDNLTSLWALNHSILFSKALKTFLFKENEHLTHSSQSHIMLIFVIC